MRHKEIEHLSEMYTLYNHRCFLCKNTATQRAHIIGNSKANRRRYGDGIIDSPLNWLPACSLYCNGLIDIGKNPHIMDHIAQLIREGDRETIESVVLENVERKKAKV